MKNKLQVKWKYYLIFNIKSHIKINFFIEIFFQSLIHNRKNSDVLPLKEIAKKCTFSVSKIHLIMNVKTLLFTTETKTSIEITKLPNYEFYIRL